MIELSTEFRLHSTQGTIISGLCYVKLFILVSHCACDSYNYTPTYKECQPPLSYYNNWKSTQKNLHDSWVGGGVCCDGFTTLPKYGSKSILSSIGISAPEVVQ